MSTIEKLVDQAIAEETASIRKLCASLDATNKVLKNYLIELQWHFENTPDEDLIQEAARIIDRFIEYDKAMGNQ